MERGVLALLLVWSCIVTVTPLTTKEVHRAIKYINDTLGLSDAKQYAYIIAFNKTECAFLKNDRINKIELLKHENKDEIVNSLNHSEDIYQGRRMIFATYKEKDNDSETDHNVHAEYRLLSNQDESCNSPAENLLFRIPRGSCVIFYSLRSPCVSLCTNCMRNQCIIPKLSVFNNIKEKAFVYNDIYGVDSARGLQDRIWEGLKKINIKFPVFRFFPNQCYACFHPAPNKNKYYCLFR